MSGFGKSQSCGVSPMARKLSGSAFGIDAAPVGMEQCSSAGHRTGDTSRLLGVAPQSREVQLWLLERRGGNRTRVDEADSFV
jgi:hypothetical protein